MRRTRRLSTSLRCRYEEGQGANKHPIFSLLMCSEEIIDTANESKDEGISG